MSAYNCVYDIVTLWYTTRNVNKSLFTSDYFIEK